MTDWTKSAATPEGRDLARIMDSQEFLRSPEGQMSEQVAQGLNSARESLRDASDALIGLKNREWRGLRLPPQTTDQLRELLKVVREHADSVERGLDRVAE